ncbi:hypothetical protein [Kineosporia sp. NBRC 101731]|nr:hypothetical protein [Kineosporia sp. NBRC 101731]
MSGRTCQAVGPAGGRPVARPWSIMAGFRANWRESAVTYPA